MSVSLVLLDNIIIITSYHRTLCVMLDISSGDLIALSGTAYEQDEYFIAPTLSWRWHN